MPPKNKSKNGEEWLRGQIRELQKENRALKKQLKQIQKKEHIFDNDQDEDLSSDSEDTQVILRKVIKCLSDSCGKGVYDEMELMSKLYGKCNVCGDQRRLK